VRSLTSHEIISTMDMTRSGDVVVAGTRAEAARVGRRLQYITMAWNSVEAVVALAAGFFAGSIALVGFGFDSVIEVTSSATALWRLGRDADEAKREAAERRSLRIIGACFLILAGYVLYESAVSLIEGKAPQRSIVGIVIAGLSLIVMPLLVHYKRRIARQLTSGALEAEARQTRVCAYLSAILLVGLGLNAWWGWWWADPLAGLGMVPLIAWEGLEAVRGRTCCAD
jgi:divalent metal cation (Fe/Co/Zn/Cd) transporter